MKKLNIDEEKKLFKMYETGNYTGKQLSEIYPISVSTVNRLLRKNGYFAKSRSEARRKYTVDENFFNSIDTEEKAYILGFLYADGYNNTDKNVVRLSLKEDDKHILDKITELIQPTKPLGFKDLSYMRKKVGFENSKNHYYLTISNKHISKRFSELGCGKAKTHNITFPSEEQVPTHLQRHFIRGYFDGDGSVSGNRQKQISILGTEIFVKSVQHILIKEINFSETKLGKLYGARENNIRVLKYCGIHQCIKFRDWLYKDATIYLNRKKEFFDNCYAPTIKQNKCSVEGCSDKYCCKGYCRKHRYEFLIKK